MKFIIIVFSFLYLSACKVDTYRSTQYSLNQFFFKHTGSPLWDYKLFSNLKEFHLEYHNLIGQRVVVLGYLKKLNSAGTFLILADNTAQILVATSSLASKIDLFSSFVENQKVLIWGQIQSGKRSLPLLMADSMILSK